MAVKIFDIIPPNEKHAYRGGKHNRFKGEHQESRENHGSSRMHSMSIPKKKKKNGLYFQLSFVIIFLLVIIGGVVYISSTTKSKVDIWPKFEEITLNKKITLTADYNETNTQVWLEKGILPAKLFTDQRTATADFPGSGIVKKDIKASGKIKVYNNYSDSSQSLIAGTRFVSEDGKLFKSTEKISIPGKKIEGGKSVPGEIEVEVEAAEAGEDYNIQPSTFSIPGFVGTAKYTAFYGKSLSAMTGGFKGDVAQVTDSDLAKANSQLFDKAGQESRQFLLKIVPADYDFVNDDKAVYQEAIEKSHSVEQGKEADSFNAKVTVQSLVLIFKKADVEALAQNVIKSSIPEGRTIDEKSLKIEYIPNESISLFDAKKEENDKDKKLSITEPASMEINIAIKFRIYASMQADQIKKTLLGKSIEDVKAILKTNEGIERIKIDSGPIWRQKLPENMNKLEVNLNI